MDNRIYVEDISTYIDDILEMEYNIKSCKWAIGIDPDEGSYIKISDVELHSNNMPEYPLSSTDIVSRLTDKTVNAFFEHLMQPVPQEELDVLDDPWDTYQDSSGNVMVLVKERA